MNGLRRITQSVLNYLKKGRMNISHRMDKNPIGEVISAQLERDNSGSQKAGMGVEHIYI